SPTGTPSSARPPTPTPSSTASSTTPTGSTSAATPCAAPHRKPRLDRNPPPAPISTCQRRPRGWAASSRNDGRDHLGMGGRHRRNPHRDEGHPATARQPHRDTAL